MAQGDGQNSTSRWSKDLACRPADAGGRRWRFLGDEEETDGCPGSGLAPADPAGAAAAAGAAGSHRAARAGAYDRAGCGRRERRRPARPCRRRAGPTRPSRRGARGGSARRGDVDLRPFWQGRAISADPSPTQRGALLLRRRRLESRRGRHGRDAGEDGRPGRRRQPAPLPGRAGRRQGDLLLPGERRRAAEQVRAEEARLPHLHAAGAGRLLLRRHPGLCAAGGGAAEHLQGRDQHGLLP